MTPVQIPYWCITSLVWYGCYIMVYTPLKDSSQPFFLSFITIKPKTEQYDIVYNSVLGGMGQFYSVQTSMDKFNQHTKPNLGTVMIPHWYSMIWYDTLDTDQYKSLWQILALNHI